jgi:hypothetical protein
MKGGDVRMKPVCKYVGQVCPENQDCLRCSLFLECCQPICNGIGYADNSEYGCYLCSGCPQHDCDLKQEINY